MDVSDRRPLPYKIQDVEEAQSEKLLKYYQSEHTGFVRVGQKGYFFPRKYREQASHIYNLPLRSDYIFVAGFPRSGSTWMRELVWLAVNDMNFAGAASTPLMKRYIFIEFPSLVDDELKAYFLKNADGNTAYTEMVEMMTKPGYERLALPSAPRFIFSHLPLSLLPPCLLDTAKMVYMARDPRDVVVSFYHFHRLNKSLGYEGDFKTFWSLFRNDCVYWTPYFESLKEAWNKRDHPNMLFLFYEDVAKDLPSTVLKVSSFFNKQYSEEQVAKLCEHLSIDNFKKNESVNYGVMEHIGLFIKGEQSFVREGKSGGWRDYFTDEMQDEVSSWIADNLRDSDIRFPTKLL